MQGDAGESDTHARQVRERKEKINEELLKKCRQNQAEAETRAEDSLQDQAAKKAENNAQRRLEWSRRYYRGANGKQKLEVWQNMKQSERMQTDGKELEHRIEEHGEKTLFKQMEDSDCRWLESCERQRRQVIQAQDPASNISDKRLIDGQGECHRPQQFTQDFLGLEASVDSSDAATLFTDHPNCEKKRLVRLQSGSTTDLSSDPSPEERKCRPLTCHKRVVQFTSTSKQHRLNLSHEALSSINVNHQESQKRSPDTLEVSWEIHTAEDEASHKNVSSSVWLALNEMVVDGMQRCMEQSLSSRSAGRLAEGEVDEILVCEVAEEVGQRAVDATVAQLTAMVTESATYPETEVIEALIGHVNDLTIDLTWDLLVPHLQGREKATVRQLWCETIMRAACELGRQAMINVVVWLQNQKPATHESSDQIAWACACLLTAVISKASCSDILQELLDPECRIHIECLLSIGLSLSDEAVKFAETQVWQYLDKNGKRTPASADILHMARSVAQSVLIRADNLVQLNRCRHARKELATDCVLETIVCNLQSRLLSGQTFETNSENLHERHLQNHRQEPNSSFNVQMNSDTTDSDNAAAQLCGITVEESCSFLQTDKLSSFSTEPKNNPPSARHSFADVLVEEAVSTIRGFSDEFLRARKIPISGTETGALHNLAKQLAEKGCSTATDHSEDKLTLATGWTLLNLVRQGTKNERCAIERQIIRSLIDANTKNVNSLIGWVLQVEQLRVLSAELQCLQDKDTERITRHQAKVFCIDSLSLYTILSRERMLTVKIITDTIKDQVHKCLAYGLLPSQKFEECIQKYTSTVVLPNAIHKMEMQLKNYCNNDAEGLMKSDLTSAVNDLADTQQVKQLVEAPRCPNDAASHSEASSVHQPYEQSQFHLLDTSRNSCILEFQNFLTSCLLTAADREVRKLITKHASTQLLHSTEHMLDTMADKIVDRAIIATEDVLHSKELTQLWAGPLLESALEGTIQLTKQWEEQKFNFRDDKFVTELTTKGLKLLNGSRDAEQSTKQDVYPNKIRCDEILASNTNLPSNSNSQQFEMSSFTTKLKNEQQTLEHFIPLMVEIIVHSALNSEIFLKIEVEPIALSRCKRFVQKLVEEAAKDTMLLEDSLDSVCMFDNITSKLLESIIRGAFNSSSFLHSDVTSQEFLHSESLIYSLTDCILQVHNTPEVQSYSGINCNIINSIESRLATLNKTALCTKAFSISSCQDVVSKSQQVLKNILEKFSLHKCSCCVGPNSINVSNGGSIEALVFNLVSKSMSILEQDLHVNCTTMPKTVMNQFDNKNVFKDGSGSVNTAETCIMVSQDASKPPAATSYDTDKRAVVRVSPSLEPEINIAHLVSNIAFRALHTVLSKPCNEVMKQQMPCVTEFDAENVEEITAFFEETLTHIILAMERDIGEQEDNQIKTMCEDLISDLVDRLILESLSCEWAYVYENWATTTFIKFLDVMKSIIVDIMLHIGTMMELFLPRDISSECRVIKNTAEEIFDETMSAVQSCCCLQLGSTLRRNISTIAAEIAKKSTESILSKVSQDATEASLNSVLQVNGNAQITNIHLKETELEEELATTTVANLQQRISDLVKSEVNEVLQQQMKGSKFRAGSDQIREVNRILASTTDKKRTQSPKESVQKAFMEENSSDDDEVIVVKAILGACKSLTRLDAQSRVAGNILDMEVCHVSPTKSQQSLQIVQDVLLSAVDEVQTQEAQVHLVMKKVMQRVRQRLRSIIQQEQKTHGDQTKSAEEDKDKSDSDKNTTPIQNSMPCLKINPITKTSESVNSKTAMQDGQCEKSECFVVDAKQNSKIETEEESRELPEKNFVAHSPRKDYYNNFYDKMVEILLSEVGDALDTNINEKELAARSINSLQNISFHSAQGTTIEFALTEENTAQLESAITINILKEARDAVVHTIHSRSNSELPIGSNPVASLTESIQHNMLSLRSSPEYLVSCLIMKAQELALCQTLESKTKTPVKDQVTNMVENTLHKAKLIDTETTDERRNCQVFEVLKKIGSCLEDEISTGRAILHHGHPLRGSTATLTTEILCHLQKKLRAELEYAKTHTIKQKTTPANETEAKQGKPTAELLKDSTKLSARYLNKLSDEQFLNESITEEVTRFLCDGMREMVEVGWQKSACSLSLNYSQEKEHLNVEPLIIKTLDDVITKIKSQAIPEMESPFMSKTISSFQKTGSITEKIPAMFYTSRTGTDCVQAILSIVRHNVSQRYVFKPDVMSQVTFTNTKSTGAMSPSSLTSPRHVPILGGKAIEESQERPSRNCRTPPLTIKPPVMATQSHQHPYNFSSEAPAKNTHFFPRIFPAPIENFLHKVKQRYPRQQLVTTPQNNSFEFHDQLSPQNPSSTAADIPAEMSSGSSTTTTNTTPSLPTKSTQSFGTPLKATVRFPSNKMTIDAQASLLNIVHSNKPLTKIDTQASVLHLPILEPATKASLNAKVSSALHSANVDIKSTVGPKNKEGSSKKDKTENKQDSQDAEKK